jgi:hypothetical protein
LAYSGHPDGLGRGVVNSELAAFMQSGVSVIVASVAPDLRPLAGLGLACRIDGTGTVRVLMRRRANVALVNAIAKGAPVAATFTRPYDHRSIQIKASSARFADPVPDDASEAARQCAGMRDALINGGYEATFASAYVSFEPGEIVAIELRPDRAFVQTPGPGAGSELSP